MQKADASVIEKLTSIIYSLPAPNAALIQELVSFLHQVVQHARSNKMTSSNIGVVFGPTVMRAGPENDDPMQEIYDNPSKIAVFSYLIDNYDKIFIVRAPLILELIQPPILNCFFFLLRALSTFQRSICRSSRSFSKIPTISL